MKIQVAWEKAMAWRKRSLQVAEFWDQPSPEPSSASEMRVAKAVVSSSASQLSLYLPSPTRPVSSFWSPHVTYYRHQPSSLLKEVTRQSAQRNTVAISSAAQSIASHPKRALRRPCQVRDDWGQAMEVLPFQVVEHL